VEKMKKDPLTDDAYTSGTLLAK
jgi:hypothetical protein